MVLLVFAAIEARTDAITIVDQQRRNRISRSASVRVSYLTEELKKTPRRVGEQASELRREAVLKHAALIVERPAREVKN